LLLSALDDCSPRPADNAAEGRAGAEPSSAIRDHLPAAGLPASALPAGDHAIGWLKTNGAAVFENAFNNIDRVMRNDEGLASELDYAEQTSWLLFLKYLDDLEAEREDAAVLDGRAYAPILDAPYRWQTWAAPKKGGKLDHNAAVTGADLIEFVNLRLFP
jgi:hypothetical protein